MATSPLTSQVGRVLSGRYRLLAPLGAGASASVYLADDVRLHRLVAVKVLHPALAGDEPFLRRFGAEARAAASLSHPHIVGVYDWGEDDGPYLVLEHLPGGSLQALLDAGHRLTPSQALLVGLQAARALEYAHRRGFVHRDIKPANLLLDAEGGVRVGDFGLARALSAAAWTEPEGGLVGTGRYMAPEQGTDQVDGRLDVYALALVVIEAVTGQVPAVGDNAVATVLLRRDGPVPVPAAVGPLRPVLRRALHPEPAERPDAAAFARALLDVAAVLERPAPLPLPSPGGGAPLVDPHPTLAADPSAGQRPAGRRRRWGWALLLVLVAVAVAAGGAYAWTVLAVPEADVPPLVDLTVGDAQARLASVQAGEELEWQVEVERRHFDNIESGVVAAQDPAAGVMLRDGGTLTLTVSMGPPPRTVPDLADLPEADARARLVHAELEVGQVGGAHSEDVPAGHVLSWLAPDGTERPVELPRGTAVDLVVSRGPAPRTVPDLTGVPADDARARLHELGLEVALTEEFSTSVERGRVIRSEPRAGGTAERGATVTLVVSKGRDLVTVPDVRGRSLEEATQALRAAGLTPNEVFGRALGRVDSTDPGAGSTVDRGTAVDVFLK